LTRQNIECFRAKLQNILDATKNTGDQYTAGVQAVVKALKSDYDALFPTTVWGSATNDETIRKLMDRFCHPSSHKCPICASKSTKRITKNGTQFIGCTKYPSCHGSRFTDGKPTLNSYMRTFLAKRLHDETLKEQKIRTNRFRNLEL